MIDRVWSGQETKEGTSRLQAKQGVNKASIYTKEYHRAGQKVPSILLSQFH